MYIEKFRIPYIDACLTFEKPAGWHVIVGENGAGKTHLLRDIADFKKNGLNVEYLSGGFRRDFSKTVFRTIASLAKNFINGSGFLPYNLKIHKFDANGTVFIDEFANYREDYEFGYSFTRMVSFTIDLMEYLTRTYNKKEVFPHKEIKTIETKAVILIDDFELHFSPATQIHFSNWLVKTFPQIQFIVTSNSPFVCRACESGGTIWKLERGEKGAECNEVTGRDKRSLIYGHILDAYSTELFGKNIEESPLAAELKQRLAELNMKKTLRIITDKEEVLRKELEEKVD